MRVGVDEEAERGGNWGVGGGRGIELLRGEITQVGGTQVLRKRDTEGVSAERKVEQRRLLDRVGESESEEVREPQ